MVHRRCGCGRPARVMVCSAVLCGLLPALMARSALAQDNLLVNSSFEEPRVGPTQDFLPLTPENPLMVLEGIPFLLDGVILVGPGSTQGALTQGPVSVVRKVAGVPVGRKVARLHFL